MVSLFNFHKLANFAELCEGGDMFKVIECLTEAGDPTHPNEDAVAVSADGRVAVVIDGLTSKEPQRDSFNYLGLCDQPHRVSDVGYTARRLARYLTAEVNHDEHPDPVALLNKARLVLRTEFNQRAVHMPQQQAEFPMCAVAMVRVKKDHTLEITNEGDTEAGVIHRDGRETYFEADAVHRFYEDARKREATRLASMGIVNKEEQRARILPLMIQHYNDYTNMPGGFGMFSLNRDVIADTVRTEIISGAREIRLYTDGLAHWYDYQRDQPGQRFMQGAPALRTMFNYVRACENGHGPVNPENRSFKRSDDASGIVLQLNA